MARLKVSGVLATLMSKPDGSRADCPVGMLGILEVWESERSHPGKSGAAFYYPLEEGADPGVETSEYFKTSFSYDISAAGGRVVFERTDGAAGTRRYEFLLEDGEHEVEPEVQENRPEWSVPDGQGGWNEFSIDEETGPEYEC